MLEAASAIVLAGGRSSRFGSDKMAAEVDGSPLLHHAVRAVTAVCEEVLVVGAPSGLPVALPEDVIQTSLELLDVELHGGPLVAVVNAAGHAERSRILIVGGDMPGLRPEILRRVLTWPPEHDGACLVVGDWAQPFPMGLDRVAAVARGRALVESGERSLRRLLRELRVEQLPETEWRALDPDAASLRDIDRPEDLVS